VNIIKLNTYNDNEALSDLNDGCRSHFTHVLNGILITKPVRAFHGVVEVPLPLVILGIAQSRVHATLVATQTHSAMYCLQLIYSEEARDEQTRYFQ